MLPRIGNAFFPNDNAADRKERFDGRAMHAPTNYTENSLLKKQADISVRPYGADLTIKNPLSHNSDMSYFHPLPNILIT